jgi:hypothetical protein
MHVFGVGQSGDEFECGSSAATLEFTPMLDAPF